VSTDHEIRQFFDLSPDVLCVLESDGRIRIANPATAHVLGWAPDEIVGTLLPELAHADERATMQDHLARISCGIAPLSFVARCRTADGRYRDLLWTVHAPNGSGLLYASGRDVTVLRRERFRWELAVDAAPAPLLLCDGQGLILLVNRAAEDTFGYLRSELVGRSIETLVPERMRDHHRRLRARYMQEPRPRPMGTNRDLTGLRRDGSEFPIEIGLTPVTTPHETLVLAAIVDLTARRQEVEHAIRQARALEEANAKLVHMASTDSLTGMWNRRAFLEQLGVQLQMALRSGRPLSLLFVDIDHFKRYNDTHGHLAGDAVLELVADVMRQVARRSDYVARIGGEEFAVLLPDTDVAGAIQLAERFRLAIEQAIWPIEPVTISAGGTTARFEPGQGEIDDRFRSRLLSEADRALYHAKQRGRNRVSHTDRID
jgi:diguanylate cyclase (GGDEF)-like protein/PAS domain S-box-containing protein